MWGVRQRGEYGSNVTPTDEVPHGGKSDGYHGAVSGRPLWVGASWSLPGRFDGIIVNFPPWAERKLSSAWPWAVPWALTCSSSAKQWTKTVVRQLINEVNYGENVSRYLRSNTIVAHHTGKILVNMAVFVCSVKVLPHWRRRDFGTPHKPAHHLRSRWDYVPY